MTENNYNKLIDAICELVNLAWDSTSKEEFERLDNAGADIIDCLEKLQQFESIGTVEEFKDLKEKNETLKALYEDARKEGNNLLARERNKAIEELLEKQLETLENFKYWEDSSGYPIHSLSETQRISKCKELIKQIAQEMKAGGKNE